MWKMSARRFRALLRSLGPPARSTNWLDRGPIPTVLLWRRSLSPPAAAPLSPRAVHGLESARNHHRISSSGRADAQLGGAHGKRNVPSGRLPGLQQLQIDPTPIEKVLADISADKKSEKGP